MNEVFRYGIEVCGERYRFLSASGSQVRDHNAIFVRADSDEYVKRLRNQVDLRLFMDQMRNKQQFLIKK